MRVRHLQLLSLARVLALANEATSAVTGLSNEISVVADGWVRIAPFGDSEKLRQVRRPDGSTEDQRFIQRLTRESAQAMVDDHSSILSKVGRMLKVQRGVPIFKRHPDLRKHAPETVTLENQGEPVPQGYFSELAVRDDGFYGRVVVSGDGEDAIANEGLKWLSPLWLVREIGTDGSAKIVAPFRLLSAGLTDRPNISGGDPLANQREQPGQTNTNMNREQILAALGLAPTAADADITATITALNASVQSVASLSNEKTTLATAKTGAEQALANEQAAHTTTRTALKAERQARIALVVADALATGKITAAEKAATEAALANESAFEAELAKLTAKPAALPLGSQTDAAGNRRQQNSAADPSQQLVALANEYLKSCHGDFAKAHARAKTARPDLVEAMAAEERARRGK